MKQRRVHMLADAIAVFSSELIKLVMALQKYFMITNAFGNSQCLLCYKTFREKKEYVLKRHYDSFHSIMNKFNDEEREEIFCKNKKIFLEKLKGWLLGEEISESISEQKLKKEISSLISLDIVRQGRPFCDGIFIKEMLKKILQRLNYNLSFMDRLPLSRQTVVRRSVDLGTSVELSIREKLSTCEFFSFCLDESTDINDLCQLVICVRCVDIEYNVLETMFSLETFYGNVTGKLLFDVVSEKLLSITDPNKFAGVCTDGANVMTGKNEGFIGHLKKNGIVVHTFHCIIHQAALASKFISDYPAMKTAERIINKIRGGHHSLTHRKFVSFLKLKNATHSDLKMFTEVRWLSRGDCINRLFELKDEVLQFLEMENIDKCLAQSLKDNDFILDLAFLADITAFLNDFNLELQGNERSIYELCKTLFNFKTKLFLLLSQLQLDDFSNFSKTSLIYGKQRNVKKYEYITIVETLFYNFQDRFKDFENIQPLLDLFENPFSCDVTNYDFDIQLELIILRSELNAPHKINVLDFWKKLDGLIYPELKKNSFKCLSLFPSTYLCEKIFSDLKFICSKQRNKMSSEHLKNILLIRNCHKSVNIEDFI